LFFGSGKRCIRAPVCFEITDGHRLADGQGADCSNDEEALKQARIVVAQIATDMPASANRRVTVMDEKGREVASVRIGEQENAA
jgi:hypothetical protein